MHTLADSGLARPYPQSIADDGQALYVSGLLALRDGEAEEAVTLLTQALRQQPAHFGRRRNLVRALLLAQRWEQVAMQANTSLEGSPDDAELHFARGTALNALGHHSDAYAAFARALSLQPNHAPSWLNMGNASVDLDDLGSAETLYRTAIGLDPGLVEAYASLGYLLTRRGKLREAIEACEVAIRLRPDFAQAHWNLAIAALLSGDLPRGFAEYEWRKRHPRHQADFPTLPGEMWDGSNPSGRTILVRAEQGLGDTIHFARYLPLIRAAGGMPILVCSAALVPLIASMPGIRAVAPSTALPAYDAWVDQASLPLAFGTTLRRIPAAEGFLQAEPGRLLDWKTRLPEGPTIGVAFAGNPKHSDDRRRSVPLELIDRLLNIRGVSLINLQYGEDARRLGLRDWTAWLTDYQETAALIAALDLVVTVDISVAHLAGALGKPVWILLPHAPDWRWFRGRTDSPWYRSVRLFRQPAAGDWSSVLARVVDEIRRHPLGN